MKAPQIMGVINVTPDSFSDGGQYLKTEQALIQARALLAEGADILDIGGESARPGAAAVSIEEEQRRTLPVIEALAKEIPRNVRLSIDTRNFEVARAAVERGASLINDVSGGRDIRLISLLKENPQCDLIAMHMQGTPQTMQAQPSYPNGVVKEVAEFLSQRVRVFAEGGIEVERIWIDPGIGFGKTVEHNLALLEGLSEFEAIGGAIVVGTSRKSFLAKLLNDPNLPFEEREAGTLASNLYAYQKGATVFRVHDVGALRRALTTWQALERGRA